MRDALLAVSGHARSGAWAARCCTVKNRDYFFDHTSKDLTELRQPAAVALPAGGPQQPVRRVPAVRLSRRRGAQRRPGDDDRRPAGPVHAEQRSGRRAPAKAWPQRVREARSHRRAERIPQLYRAGLRPRSDSQKSWLLARSFWRTREQLSKATCPRRAQRSQLAWEALCQSILAANEFIYVR